MPRQSDLRFAFTPASDDIALEVVSFALTEGLSEPFRLALELSSHDPAIDFGQLLDRPAGLTLWRGDAPVRHVHGIVTSFEQRDTGFRRTRYSAIVEPALARAALASDWRTFQQVSVPDIVAGVLKAQGIVDNRVQLSTTHLAREYAVQAGETHLAFTARLLSEEGMVYAFEHRDGGHTLVYTDNVQSLGCIGGEPVLYNAEHSGDQATPCLWRFTYAEHVRTAQQAQRDYSFRQPQYDQQHVRLARDLDHQGDRYERYDYPGRYKEVAAGAPFTATRLLARRADAQRATVEGDDARLRVGLGFELVGHHREELNQLWRPVRITHHGVQHSSQEEDGAGSELGTQYRLTAELVAAATEWKAPLCPKPRIDGPQMATVVGPPGEEIYCDPLGRVRVQFPWDRVGKRDDHSSCWVRVAQQWAGPAWGHMAIPRVGHEVIVDFLDGDPDQPIVTGRTYHAANLPPYKLPDFKTVSPVRTKEHRGNRANELRLDDTTEQISAALMSDHAHSALHLGYLTHPRPRGGEPRGEGFELRSDGSGALRAARGLLLTTEGDARATGGQLSRDELIRCLEGALDLAKGLGEYAARHNGAPHDAAPQQTLSNAVSALSKGANDDRQGTGGGEPVIALSSTAGIAAGTSRSVTLAAGEHIDSVAELNQQITAGKDIVMNAGGDLGIFVHGGNLSQIAHQGDLLLEAQKQNIRLHADKSVQISATDEHVLVTAEKHITLMCGGAFIKMEGGNIEMVMPGTLKVRAAVYDMDGGSSAGLEPNDTLVDDVRRQFIVDYTEGGGPVANQPYQLTLASGEVIKGVTDASGATELIERSAMHDISLALQGNSSGDAS